MMWNNRWNHHPYYVEESLDDDAGWYWNSDYDVAEGPYDTEEEAQYDLDKYFGGPSD